MRWVAMATTTRQSDRRAAERVASWSLWRPEGDAWTRAGGALSTVVVVERSPRPPPQGPPPQPRSAREAQNAHRRNGDYGPHNATRGPGRPGADRRYGGSTPPTAAQPAPLHRRRLKPRFPRPPPAEQGPPHPTLVEKLGSFSSFSTSPASVVGATTPSPGPRAPTVTRIVVDRQRRADAPPAQGARA